MDDGSNRDERDGLAFVFEFRSKDTLEAVKNDMAAQLSSSPIMRIYRGVEAALRPRERGLTRVVFTGDLV